MAGIYIKGMDKETAVRGLPTLLRQRERSMLFIWKLCRLCVVREDYFCADGKRKDGGNDDVSGIC